MEKLPPITFANGQNMPVSLHLGEGGRRRIILGADTPANSSSPRITFRIDEDSGEAHFAGMLFKHAPKELSAGMSMLGYFFETALSEMGLQPGETSVIRKPIIALQLGRYGLVADLTLGSHVEVGVLPRSRNERSSRPNVHFIQGNLDELEKPEHGRFYKIIPGRELPFLYPLEQPSVEVDLHTSFLP